MVRTGGCPGALKEGGGRGRSRESKRKHPFRVVTHGFRRHGLGRMKGIKRVALAPPSQWGAKDFLFLQRYPPPAYAMVYRQLRQLPGEGAFFEVVSRAGGGRMS